VTPTAEATPAPGSARTRRGELDRRHRQGLREHRLQGAPSPHRPPPTTRSRPTSAAWPRRPTTTSASRLGGADSPVGTHPHRARRRTRRRRACASAWCPAPTGRPATSRSYRHLAARGDLDAVAAPRRLHLRVRPASSARGTVVRPHARQRDPHARRLPQRHGSTRPTRTSRPCTRQGPVIAIWDDHEFANDAWSGGAENHTEGTEGTWRPAKAAATRRTSSGCRSARRSRAPPTAACASASSPTSSCSTCAPSARSRWPSATARSTTRTVRSPAPPRLDWLKNGLKASDTSGGWSATR
jgi:hypothetical protein